MEPVTQLEVLWGRLVSNTFSERALGVSPMIEHSTYVTPVGHV